MNSKLRERHFDGFLCTCTSTEPRNLRFGDLPRVGATQIYPRFLQQTKGGGRRSENTEASCDIRARSRDIRSASKDTINTNES